MLLPNQPKFLSQLGFRLVIDKIPTVTFFTQVCPIPELSMGSINIGTPVQDYHVPSDKIDYDDLELSFIVDEDLKNYKELQHWIYGLGHPESLDQFKEFSESEKKRLFGRTSVNGQSQLTSDGILSILTNNNNINLDVHFTDLFPIRISTLTFGTTAEDTTYITCNATFRYTYFKFH